MLFYKPLQHIVIPTLKIDSTELNLVLEFNFLGLFVDKHMSWNKHVRTVSSKISQIIDIMNKLKDLLPTNILLTLYNQGPSRKRVLDITNTLCVD